MLLRFELTPLFILPLLLSCLLGARPVKAQDAGLPTHNLVLSLESYVDDATVRNEQSLANLQNEQGETEVGRGLLSGSVSLTYLTPLTDIFLVGAGARYLGSYRYEEDDAEEDDEPTLMGRLFELYGRAEFRITLTEDIQVVPAAELGVPLMFPSGSLQERLDMLETTSYSVNSLPRTGFLLGGEVGGRLRLEHWLALRAAFGVVHEKLFLYDASTEDDIGQASSSFSLVRLKVGLGAEVNF
ncbi:MAG: hypothetical protein OXR73_32235 [Myxococcales bacterium]|nr:hypothetical protein [Myxococcales bacterium]